MRVIKPLYAARLEDLVPGDLVKVECVACGHESFLPPEKIRIKGIAPPPHTPVVDLQYRLRCRECDERGKVLVSIRWVVR